MLRAIEIILPALAQDGSIRQRTELVMPSRNNERLALRKRFLLKETSRKLWRSLTGMNGVSVKPSAQSSGPFRAVYGEVRNRHASQEPQRPAVIAIRERPGWSHGWERRM